MSIIDTLKEVASDFKCAAINPHEIKDPARLAKICQAAKIITVALAVIAVAAAVFSGPLGLIFAALFGLMMYDSYKMAGNIEQIAEDRVLGKEIKMPESTQEMIQNVSRGTIFAKPILGLSLPEKSAADETIHVE